MPQRFGLYEDLTVEENIYFFGHLFGVSNNDIAHRLKKLYEFSRLEPFRNRLAGKLSGGMKQKLGLACALVHTPKVLILDEPTNGVDPVSRREFWMILYDLLADGVTIIVSTAYLDEAERCGRVAFIHKGKFITVDTPQEIKKTISDRFFIAETDEPMKAKNLLSAKLPHAYIITTGSSLRIFLPRTTTQPVQKIRHAFSKGKVATHKIHNADPSLEDCFLKLINSSGKSAGKKS